MGNRRNEQTAVQSTDLTADFRVRHTVKRVGLCVLCCLVLLTLNGMGIIYTTTSVNPYQRIASVLLGEHPEAIISVRLGPSSRNSTGWIPDKLTNRFFRDTNPQEGSFISFQGGQKAELTFRINPNYNMSTCPDSIQQKMLNNSKGVTIFHPEIHQLINSQLLNNTEYTRLRPYYMPFGYKTKTKFAFKDVQDTLKLFPAKDSIFDFSDEKPRPRCLSCAIIGNGGILNGSKKGEEIDRHDMVFRVNNAVRRNHMHDVGNRTTHYFFFDRSLRGMSANDVPYDKGLIYVFLPCRYNDYKYIAGVVMGKDPKIKVAADTVRFLHPDFVRYFHKIWINTPKKTFRPSTGAIMFLTALHAGCDSVSVYGIGHTDDYTYYYYDAKFTSVNWKRSVHDTRAELYILQGLDRIGTIDWYKRDVSSFRTN
ncbi:alpha-N-acetylgalactosaminide alpha-2,6-sialyltransferase 2-like isoform X1 [Asterias amurensis]|uniref:alpha-N-acetylgalactosaminide alpha-2,6-sialyltransferase 2-like isoform X1 n=1 Tax=Asterias amurensis TaxID=7602 RepID=UPI003AB59BD2